MKVTKVISTTKNNLQQLLTKVLKSGRSDVQEVKTASLPGIDSVPLADDIALYEETEIVGENFIIGFIPKNRVANPGELRIYARDTNGTEKIYLYLKDDGTIEFGGTAKNLVRFQELETGFNELKGTVNDMVEAWNLFCSSYLPGSPTTVGTPPTLSTSTITPSTADISGAKINEFKTL